MNLKIDGNKEWVTVFDIHFPFHHVENYNAFLKYLLYLKGKKLLPPNLLLGGDIFDFVGVGSFPKDGRTNLFKEIKSGMKDFNKLLSLFKEVVYITGNHEYRLRRYLIKNAEELMEFLNSTAEATEFVLTKCGMQHKNILFYDCIQDGEFIPVKFRDLNVFHGHELKTGGQVDLCRKMFANIISHSLFGHFHTAQRVLRRTLDKKVYITECAGTFQGKSFLPHNHWTSTFHILKPFKTKNFKIETHYIIEGEIY